MTPSSIAADTVAAQIAGLDAEVARIDEQIAQLRARREGIVMMQGVLKPLVAHRIKHDDGIVSQSNMLPLMVASGRPVIGDSNPLAGTGFREAVRKVLRDHPKGLRPAEVLSELEKRGELVRYTGKSKPSARVHNELYVLRKGGAISRRGQKYMLAAPAGGTVN